jgi:hypothetical protein
MTYTCTNDRYSNDSDTYESIEEFQAMCLACHGERAQLTDNGDTVTDETGAVVLRRVAD